MKTKPVLNVSPTLETRNSEIKIFTSNPAEMLGKYIAQRVTRTWFEDFIDEDTKEVVTIPRHELIAESGLFIDQDLLAELQFHLQAGEIDSVEVSNQRRMATLYKGTSLEPWTITANINGKNKKLLLYADSMTMANEVATDYIELNFQGLFKVTGAKEFGNCIVIKDSIVEAVEVADVQDESAEAAADKKFYKIDVSASWDETGSNYTFIVHAANVDSGMVIINRYLTELIMSFKSKNEDFNPIHDPIEFETKIAAASPIPCSLIIDKEFSLAYTNE